eukprot:TRINITY_DN6394_c0_g1_i2.p1 TRINITY_DN6394_c0_g1~~TRINITY_DN6394_c0_g1_i2.p1  ORF type:complete len:515 (-),score=72.07 TRINITY_DN6394_c0_g1_i2:312-1799(-)
MMQQLLRICVCSLALQLAGALPNSAKGETTCSDEATCSGSTSMGPEASVADVVAAQSGRRLPLAVSKDQVLLQIGGAAARSRSDASVEKFREIGKVHAWGAQVKDDDDSEAEEEDDEPSEAEDDSEDEQAMDGAVQALIVETESNSDDGLALEASAEAAAQSQSCCDRCHHAPFCSPVSWNCYKERRKSYYLSCKREPTTTTTTTPCLGNDCPLGWPATDMKSGSGKWCEVPKPPSDWVALKKCPSGLPSMKLKVLTYNLYWWNLFERRRGENGRAGRKIALTVESLEYDLMGFQECKDIDRVMRDAKGHGLEGDYATLSLVREDRALGMAYLKSRWALLESGTADVGEDRRWQYYGKRAVQWARLRNTNNDAVVFFINHHGPLPVSAGGSCAGSSVGYNILRIIAEHARASDVVVLVGDFNAQAHSSRIKALDRHMHRVHSGTAMDGVDHVYSNCAGHAIHEKRNLGRGGSDHDALSVVFSVGGSTSPAEQLTE